MKTHLIICKLAEGLVRKDNSDVSLFGLWYGSLEYGSSILQVNRPDFLFACLVLDAKLEDTICLRSTLVKKAGYKT